MSHFHPATDAQIIESHKYDIDRGRKVQFRHYGLETYHWKSKTGCQHIDHGRAKIRVIDGAPYVQHRGKLERVTASFFYGPSTGTLCLIDLRLASLPSKIEGWVPACD